MFYMDDIDIIRKYTLTRFSVIFYRVSTKYNRIKGPGVPTPPPPHIYNWRSAICETETLFVYCRRHFYFLYLSLSASVPAVHASFINLSLNSFTHYFCTIVRSWYIRFFFICVCMVAGGGVEGGLPKMEIWTPPLYQPLIYKGNSCFIIGLLVKDVEFSNNKLCTLRFSDVR
jgi:hypothetical protein